jgi:hypothetical protein
VLNRIEFGAQRGVDHAAAQFDHEAADDRRINLDLKVDILAAGCGLERRRHGVAMLVVERFGDRHLGSHLALVAGDQRSERLEDILDREQPPIGGDDLENIAGKPTDTGLLEHCCQCAALLFGGEDGALHQPGEVGAFGDQCIETVEVRLDGIDRFFVARQLK